MVLSSYWKWHTGEISTYLSVGNVTQQKTCHPSWQMLSLLQMERNQHIKKSRDQHIKQLIPKCYTSITGRAGGHYTSFAWQLLTFKVEICVIPASFSLAALCLTPQGSLVSQIFCPFMPCLFSSLFSGRTFLCFSGCHIHEPFFFVYDCVGVIQSTAFTALYCTKSERNHSVFALILYHELNI